MENTGNRYVRLATEICQKYTIMSYEIHCNGTYQAQFADTDMHILY